MDYFDKSFSLLLADHLVFDSWQYIQNVQKNMITASYCSEVVKKAIILLSNNQETISSIAFNALEQEGSFEFTNDHLPDKSINFLNIEVSLSFIIGKYIKDFFQYIRNSYDSLAQVINTVLLANKGYSIESVDFAFIKRELNKIYKTDFPLTCNAINTILQSSEYNYLVDYNNYIKHIHEISQFISFEFLGNEIKAYNRGFNKRGKSHNLIETNALLDNVFEFTQKGINDVLDAIYTEFQLGKFNLNRIHDVKCHIQNMKEKSSLNHVVIYIQVENNLLELSSEIRIMLLKKRDEVIATNCDYGDILIRNKDGEYLGRYVANEAISEFDLLKYRKYTLDSCDGFTAFNEHINKNYGYKPLLMDLEFVTDE